MCSNIFVNVSLCCCDIYICVVYTNYSFMKHLLRRSTAQSCLSINERSIIMNNFLKSGVMLRDVQCLELFQCATLTLKVICCGYEFETFAACV